MRVFGTWAQPHGPQGPLPGPPVLTSLLEASRSQALLSGLGHPCFRLRVKGPLGTNRISHARFSVVYRERI